MISESNALAANPPWRIHWYSIGPINNEMMDRSNTYLIPDLSENGNLNGQPSELHALNSARNHTGMTSGTANC